MKTYQWTMALRGSLIFCIMTVLGPIAHAGDITLGPGAEPCEADWISRQPLNTLPSVEILKFVEREAERGEVSAQYRLGMVFKTLDGKWTAPADHSYNIQWLERAIKGGSKSAAAQLAILQWRPFKPRTIDHATYIKALMSAAIEERNPWVATTLMNYTRDRWGKSAYGKGCSADDKPDGCNALDLLPKSDTRKWAEIAAEGGNPVAQELLCRAADYGSPELGQPKDDKATYKWCLIAAHNACALWPAGHLAGLFRRGGGRKKMSLKRTAGATLPSSHGAKTVVFSIGRSTKPRSELRWKSYL